MNVPFPALTRQLLRDFQQPAGERLREHCQTDPYLKHDTLRQVSYLTQHTHAEHYALGLFVPGFVVPEGPPCLNIKA